MHFLTPFTKAVRRWPKGALMPKEVMENTNDFYDFCIEHLWDKLAAEEGKDFDALSPTEQIDIDFSALLELCKTLEAVRAEARAV